MNFIKFNREAIVSLIRKIRTSYKLYYAELSLQHVMLIRQYELEIVVRLMPDSGKLLEVGSGAGWQAFRLAEKGYDVSAIDLVSSNLKAYQIWPVIDYDGVRIPFGDNTFDIVFSSNVLEHISELRLFQQELHRVLDSDGLAVHIVPSGLWRWWTNITHIIKCWSLPKSHGEHAGNAWIEIFFFSRKYWQGFFEDTGWEVITYTTNELFYTGHSTLNRVLSIKIRHLMSYILGSSCHVFALRPVKTKTNAQVKK
jgi:SAM-dependent methyltransferase